MGFSNLTSFLFAASTVVHQVRAKTTRAFLRGKSEAGRGLEMSPIYPEAKAQYIGDRRAQSVAIGDVNGDGAPDIVFGNLFDVNELFINDGSGNFPAAATATLPGGELNTLEVEMMDFNNDGYIDIFSSNSDNMAQHLLLHDQSNNTNPYPTAIAIPNLPKTNSRACHAVDIDQDGNVDILIGNYVSESLVLLGDGAGNFPKIVPLDDDQFKAYAMKAADINGDGHLDIIVGYTQWGPSPTATNRLHVHLNDGLSPPSFTRVSVVDVEESIGVVTGDFNNDGRIDIAICNGRRFNNKLLINNGNDESGIPTFSVSDLPSNSQAFSIDAADVNGDGAIDIVIAHYDHRNRLLLNNGTGGFDAGDVYELPDPDIEHQYSKFGQKTYDVTIGDLNGDSWPDIVIGQRETHQHQIVLINDFAPAASSSLNLSPNKYPTSVPSQPRTSPDSNPTKSPTSSPSSQRTMSQPITSPTISPTKSPTCGPSSQPTTSRPTTSPTSSPSKSPTSSTNSLVDNEPLSEGVDEEQVNEVKDATAQVNTSIDRSNITDNSPHSENCEDDPRFVQRCVTYVQQVERPALREVRCNRPTGIIDNGTQLLVKHLCRHSCGMCDRTASTSLTSSPTKSPTSDPSSQLTTSLSTTSPTLSPTKSLTSSPSSLGDNDLLREGGDKEQLSEVEDVTTQGNASINGSNIVKSPPPSAGVEVNAMVEEGPSGQGGDVGQVSPEETSSAEAQPHNEHPGRISTDCEDDPTFVLADEKNHTCLNFIKYVGRHTLHEVRCNRPTGIVDNGAELLVKHFCRHSCGMCDSAASTSLTFSPTESPTSGLSSLGDNETLSEGVNEGRLNEAEDVTTQVNANIDGGNIVKNPPPSAGVYDGVMIEEGHSGQGGDVAQVAPEENSLAQALPHNKHPGPTSEDCEDDPTFVLADEKHHTCLNFIKLVGRPLLHEVRCNRSTGIVDNGAELLVKHFCRQSCGMCDSAASTSLTFSPTKSPTSGLSSLGDIEPLSEGVNEGHLNEVAGVTTQVNANIDGSNIVKNPPPSAGVYDGVMIEEGHSGQGGDVGQVSPEEKFLAQALPHTEHSGPISEDCEDDPTFVLADEKNHTCLNFIKLVGRPLLHEVRCNRPTGIMDNGAELLVKHFCRHSCGMCDSAASTSLTFSPTKSPTSGLSSLGDNEPLNKEVNTGKLNKVGGVTTQINASINGSNNVENQPPSVGLLRWRND